MATECIFCLETGLLRRRQILLRGRQFYICAPKGQLAEGSLAIAPFRCRGSLSLMPADCFDELESLQRLVVEFYRESFGVTCGTFYEQGRGGGGAAFDELSGFPLHAHLCSLPLAVNLHCLLTQRYVARPVSSVRDLPQGAENQPYVYVESVGGDGRYRKRVYLASDADGRRQLARNRLKPAIAALMGVPERGDWRAESEGDELRRLVQKFDIFRRQKPQFRTSRRDRCRSIQTS